MSIRIGDTIIEKSMANSYRVTERVSYDKVKTRQVEGRKVKTFKIADLDDGLWQEMESR